MNIYCPNCGSRNTYTLHKPKFCQDCGGSFNESTARVPTNVSRPKREEDEYAEHVDNSSFASMQKIDFEVETFNKEPVKLGDIIPPPAKETDKNA